MENKEQGTNRKRKRAKKHRKAQEDGEKVPNKQQKKNEIANIAQNTQKPPASTAAKPQKSNKASKTMSTSLEKMKEKLLGGHFRMLNEKLYTCTGKEALEYFEEDPSLFDMYHEGYQKQMLQWPEQPVNIIINWIRDQSPSLVVADFGCGDARLSKSVKNKVFSFDLVSKDPSVIACDMSSIPLGSATVDIAVFCLSLMGTDFQSYLKEAARVLKPSGWLLIAEVRSRFDPTTGGADPKKFSQAICELGFTSTLQDFSNKMFILFHFKKKEKHTPRDKEIEFPKLKPCLYKRR